MRLRIFKMQARLTCQYQMNLTTESCYQSDSEIEIHLAGSDEEGKSSDRERNEKLQQDLGSWPVITDVLNHVLMNYL